MISLRNFIDLKLRVSQNPFERNTLTLMSSSYNDNTISYVPSTDGAGQRRMTLPNPPLGWSRSGLGASRPTPFIRAGASMPSKSRKTSRHSSNPRDQHLHVPSDVSNPGQAGTTPSSSTEAGALRLFSFHPSIHIPKTLYQTDPWCVCSVVKYL